MCKIANLKHSPKTPAACFRAIAKFYKPVAGIKNSDSKEQAIRAYQGPCHLQVSAVSSLQNKNACGFQNFAFILSYRLELRPRRGSGNLSENSVAVKSQH